MGSGIDRTVIIAIVACSALVGCEGIDVGSIQPAESEVFASPSPTLVPLPDGRLVIEQDERLVVIDPADPMVEPMVVGPASEVGEVHAAVRSEGAILVLASGGTFTLRGDAWVPSELASAFDGPIVDAVRLPTPTGLGLGDLWVATATSLYRIVDGVAERFGLEEDLTDVQLAIAPRPEGPALWVLLPDRLLEVWRDRSGVVRSAHLELETVPTAIGGSASPAGVLSGWLVLEGELYGIGTDRHLVRYPTLADRIISSTLAEEVWVLGSEGPRLFADGALLDVTGVTLDGSSAIALGPDGALFVSDSTIRRVAARRRVSVGGAANGSLLVRPQVFPIDAEGAPTIEARIDGNTVEPLTDPLRVELDPAALGDGSHTLEILVTYDDGTLPVREARTFEVVTGATWDQDILPIYTQYCARCHGAEGPANTRLDAPDEWQTLFDVVVANVTDGRMPLNSPPLSQREIAIIQAWEAGGFTE
ncbi:MAG: cytochrome c [Sandaracinaceae bacterium]